MSTILTSNLAGPSSTGTAAVLSSINGGPISGTRNRIINGDMRIDQRNAGAAVTITASSTQYITDRFTVRGTQASKLTAQQSSVAPSGFSNSLLCTSSSAYSITSSDYFVVEQRIEGYNTADLAFGTSAASTITLSFWVRSSLTGTFGGALSNSVLDRTYPFSYTISSANTWEKKTVTLSGDTSGTWITTNGIGLTVFWSLGAGASLSGTAGSWSGSTLVSATGATSMVGTNGATFYITGVQLEAGTVATPFERRSYGQELALCQRYYAVVERVAIGAYAAAASGVYATIGLPVNMRAAPTLTKVGTWSVSNCGQPILINASSSSFVAYVVATALGMVLSSSDSTAGQYITASIEL